MNPSSQSKAGSRALVWRVGSPTVEADSHLILYICSKDHGHFTDDWSIFLIVYRG